MERHEGKFETDAGYHECECHYQESACLTLADGDCKIIKIERSAGEGVDKRQTHEKQCRGEHGCHDILDGCLMALVVILIERNECGKRK